MSEQKIKERPILFNAEMVRAILDGRKTQTRRIVKGMALDWLEKAKFDPFYVASPDNDTCPNGKIGDQIWVRETFQPIFADGFDHDSSPYPDYKTGYGYAVSYPATDKIIEWVDADDNITCACKPSIFMPRWASRIQLEIVSVRLEHLKDISEEDAKAEGVTIEMSAPIGQSEACNINFPWSHHLGFAWLWESINGAGSWEQNPWVWVIEFKRLKP